MIIDNILTELRSLRLFEYTGTGVMLAYFLPPLLAKELAIYGGESPEDLHITLCYFGNYEDMEGDMLERLAQVCQAFARTRPPMQGAIGGIGRFNSSNSSEGKDVFYASADIPELPEFRQQLLAELQRSSVHVRQDHGFTPHITLQYLDPTARLPLQRINTKELVIDRLTLAVGDKDRRDFPLLASRINL